MIISLSFYRLVGRTLSLLGTVIGLAIYTTCEERLLNLSKFLANSEDELGFPGASLYLGVIYFGAGLAGSFI